MKYLKTFESVPLGDWYPQQPSDVVAKLNTQVKLLKIGAGVYSLQVKDHDLRGLIFLKPQEFYEGYSDRFRNQAFEIEDYMEWYKEYYHTGTFDYGPMWQGFNVPSNVLEACFQKNKKLTYYDHIMLSAMETIKQEEGDNKYYLVGVDQRGGVLSHEFAHAMYYLLPAYKEAMLALIEEMDDDDYKLVSTRLDEMGYAENVLLDEIQAWVATSNMRKTCKIGQEFVTLFKSYYKDNILPAVEIPIQYHPELHANP